jgi:hypothetical protein
MDRLDPEGGEKVLKEAREHLGLERGRAHQRIAGRGKEEGFFDVHEPADLLGHLLHEELPVAAGHSGREPGGEGM